MRPPILQDGKSVVRFAIFGQNRGFGSFWEIFRLRMTVAIERAVKLYGTTICVLCSLQLVVTFCCDWSSIALGVFKSETKATNSCLMERSKVFFKKKKFTKKMSVMRYVVLCVICIVPQRNNTNDFSNQ